VGHVVLPTMMRHMVVYCLRPGGRSYRKGSGSYRSADNMLHHLNPPDNPAAGQNAARIRLAHPTA
jgi:hypothetical protein